MHRFKKTRYLSIIYHIQILLKKLMQYLVMKKDCEMMPTEEFQDICVLGVVSSLAYRFVGDMDKMIQFCKLVDDNHKETCFRQIGAGLLDWSADKNLAIENCQKIKDPQGESWCMSVI